MRILKRVLISIFVFGLVFAGSKAYLSKFDTSTDKEVQKKETPSQSIDQSIENDFTLPSENTQSEESSSYDSNDDYNESEDESSNGNYYTDDFYNSLYYNDGYDDGEY
ncbi:MAG: hypothetical protein Q4B36_05990 [Tissierellia bacterium]|nr:hypothetical protein [Tissierellia bacterium]